MTGTWYFSASASTFLLCLMLGGGTRTGFLSDAVLQLASVPVLCWSLWRLPAVPLGRWAGVAIAIGAAAIALPLLQLIPLPIVAWQSFPARGAEVAVLNIAGGSPSVLPISVSTEATLLAALSLVPAAAVLLSVLQMNAGERRKITLLFVAFGVASAFLGLLQLSQGPNSALRFFEITNPQDAVGLFANRNHFATLINCAIVFAVAWTAHVTSLPKIGGRDGSRWILSLSMGLTAIIVLVAGAAMARSRAGILGTAAAIIAGFALALRSGAGHSNIKPVRAVLGAVTFSLLLALQFALYRLVDRFTADPLQDARRDFARATLEAIKAYFPYGSGLGTFTRVYPTFERPQQALLDTYVNRAHNDFLEFALEAGLYGGLLIAAITTSVAILGWRAWTKRQPVSRQLDATLARAASIVLGLIALHSALDYPLRTTAMMAVACLAFALVFEAPDRLPNLAAASPFDGTPAETTTSVASIFEVEQPERPSERKLWGEGIDWPDEWRDRDGSPGKS